MLLRGATAVARRSRSKPAALTTGFLRFARNRLRNLTFKIASPSPPACRQAGIQSQGRNDALIMQRYISSLFSVTISAEKPKWHQKILWIKNETNSTIGNHLVCGNFSDSLIIFCHGACLNNIFPF